MQSYTKFLNFVTIFQGNRIKISKKSFGRAVKEWALACKGEKKRSVKTTANRSLNRAAFAARLGSNILILRRRSPYFCRTREIFSY